MNLLSWTFIAVSLFISATNADQTYNGYHLIQVFPSQKSHFELLARLEETDTDFDVWNTLKAEPARFDILLPPVKFIKYKHLFESMGMRVETIDANIQNEINKQNRELKESRLRSHDSILFRYVRHQEIQDFVADTVAANSDLATSYVAGSTEEGREMTVIVLNPVKTSTRSLWIDCGIHAREWVSPATCVYIIDTMIKEYRAKDPETVAIFNKYQIHILPVANPDGYEYSHTTKRLWRKNRRTNFHASCAGVDLNRNWGYKWMTGGASNYPCSDVYAGDKANSELETQAIQNALRKREGNWDVYFNVHAYSSVWLLPYGYQHTWVVKPDNYDDMLAKAEIGTKAIEEVNGESFKAGTSADLLYINSGSSKDWAYGELKIPYSYVLELRPGMNSPDFHYGFLYPESKMPLVATETYAGIKAMFSAIV